MKQQKVFAFKPQYFGFRLLLSVVITLSPLVFQSLPACANNLPVKDALNQAMISMNTTMSSTPMIGNPDVDFAEMMIPHHLGAIEMAKVELKYGTDPRLRRLAQEILVTQQSEIALMQLVLEHPLPAPSSSSP
ncbi:DUF305 domain-containing protein [Tolypothrix bouteillei VB521301_2]|uniref:CopM family metallochaperone n=1 Tax=Tolypothrix bouteillei TaxID=1246981 RepID=UPI000513EF9A